ncbi:MAG: hypothetical protein EKE20_15045 [Candidatus Symbiopectobacterium sp. Dall1.0]|nr:hypothetical protein [Candidatus Symbiopectobacterium sp. Dall1.0]
MSLSSARFWSAPWWCWAAPGAVRRPTLTLGVYLGSWVTHGGVARFSAGRRARKQGEADAAVIRTD